MNIVAVNNSAAALESLRTEIFDIVLCDLEIGPIDLWDFRARLRWDKDMLSRRVPVVLMTDHQSRKLVERARDSGTNDILVRPLTARAVQQRLTSAVLSPRSFVSTADFAGPYRRRRKGRRQSVPSSDVVQDTERRERGPDRRRGNKPAPRFDG